ncbi:MAG: putative metal-binding motif-containing protein [Candidatus Uhrbacteria bacterium]
MTKTLTNGGSMSRISCLVALMGAFSTSAFAATPCAPVAPCKTAAPVVVTPPSDCGASNDTLCDATTDVDKDGYYSDSLSMLDCDDAHATVYPGALPVIGDGLDNDCSGDTDDEEIAAAEIAAGGETSPAGIVLAKDIDSCVNSTLEGTNTFVWSKEPKKSWTCNGLTDGLSFERGKGVLTETQTHDLETSRRIAGDRAALVKAKAEATAEIEVAKAAMKTDADADKAYFAELISKGEATIVELTAQIAAYDARLVQFETDAKHAASIQKGKDGIQDSRLDGHDVAIGDLQRKGMIFEVGVGAGFLAQRSLEDAEGTVYRSGTVGVGNFVTSIGYGIPNASITLDLSFGEGSTGSLGGTIPDTVASAAVVGQYRHEDMAIGPMLALSGNATGNLLDPEVSGWGPSVGVAASWFAPNEKGLRVEVKTHVTLGIESFGADTSATTKYWDSGLMGEGGVTVLVGGGPRN